MNWMDKLLSQAQQINESAIRENVGNYKNTVPQFSAVDSMMPPEFSHIDVHRNTGISTLYKSKAKSF